MRVVMPKRIQRKRTKGWRMPLNTVYVGRPTHYGNPFPVDVYGSNAIEFFRRWITGEMSTGEMSEMSYYGDPRIGLAHMRHGLLLLLPTLRGKDLACWCPLTSQCHADVLLRLANI